MPRKKSLAAPTDNVMLVVQFLIPTYDRDGRPYPRSTHHQIQHDIEERYDGWSLAAKKPLKGAWRNPESGDIEYNESWRYEIGIPPSRLSELDDYLAKLSHHLGQKALWRVVYAGGEGKVIPAKC